MDDPQLFNGLIETTLGVTTAWTREALYDFVNTYSALLPVTDKDIDNFVKTTHAAAKVFIPSNVVVVLKAILFELKDRDLCVALPNQQVLHGITLDQLRVLRGNRNKALEMIEIRKISGL